MITWGEESCSHFRYRLEACRGLSVSDGAVSVSLALLVWLKKPSTRAHVAVVRQLCARPDPAAGVGGIKCSRRHPLAKLVVYENI